MKKHDNDEDFLRTCKTMLDQSVEDVDVDTQKALSKMRRDAIAGIESDSHKKSFWFAFAPYQAIAATAMVVAVVSLSLHLGFSTPSEELPQLDDMLLLTTSDELAFYQELDFYHWLEQEQVDG